MPFELFFVHFFKALLALVIFMGVLLFIAYIIEIKAKTIFKYLQKGVKKEFITKRGFYSLFLVALMGLFFYSVIAISEGMQVVAQFFNMEQTEGHSIPLYMAMTYIFLTAIANIISISLFDE